MESKPEPLVRKVLVCRRCEAGHGLPPNYDPKRPYFCQYCGFVEKLKERLEVRACVS